MSQEVCPHCDCNLDVIDVMRFDGDDFEVWTYACACGLLFDVDVIDDPIIEDISEEDGS